MSTTAQQIGELIKADPKRHATEHPLFVVYEWEKILTDGEAEEYEWWSTGDDPAPVDRRTAKRLDSKGIDEPDGYRRWGVHRRRRFLTACLTREGAENFIDANRHRYPTAHVYVESLYRNEEMIAVRQHLMDLAQEARA